MVGTELRSQPFLIGENNMSSGVAQYEVHGTIAVITLDNAPVNALGQALRTGIVSGIGRAERDVRIVAVVIIGNEWGFSAGADITEFATASVTADPNLREVIDIVEGSTKPIVAAISGTCLGGGLELALACHYRIATAGAKLGLPEVKLGLIPGAGGTQRLPRLIGVEPAISFIVSGAVVPAERFWGTQLLNLFVEDGLRDKAIEFARLVAANRNFHQRVQDMPVVHENSEAFFLFARNMVGAMAKTVAAPLKCLEAVQASVKRSFAEGIAFERKLFGELMISDESRALRHLFLAERCARQVGGIAANSKIAEIESVAIIGVGTMGRGIAISFLTAGIPVVLVDTGQDRLSSATTAIRKTFEAQVAKRTLKPAKVEEFMAMLKATTDYEDLKDVDLAIEAVFEDISVKEEIFRKLDVVCRPSAIFASNTSTLDLDRIAAFTKRPQNVIGTHFFSPANVMKLLEIIRGAKTSTDVLATILKLSSKIKKTAVVSGVCDGFIGNRMINKYALQAMLLLNEGASIHQIDGALEAFGMAMGPFKMSDLAGNDIGWAIRKRQYAEDPTMPRMTIADRLCEMGRFGQKSGLGWYRYEVNRREAFADPVIEALVKEEREANSVVPRKISDEEIVERCIYALVNEGARILDEGIAQRASDIDLVYIYGYGFPAHRGGPMFFANSVGLRSVERTMKKFAGSQSAPGEFWEPARLLMTLAAQGNTFN